MRQSTLAVLAAHLAVGWVTTGSSSAFVPTGGSSSFHHNSDPHYSLLQRQGSPRFVAVDRQFSHDIEDKHAHQKQNHVQSLWVFVHNLQRERRDKGLQRQKQQRPAETNQAQQSRIQETAVEKQYHPAKSLVSFLTKNRFLSQDIGHHQEDGTQHVATREQPADVEPFSRAVVQAIRLASELGDYKLIIHLVEASIHYANQHPIIMPRVFGEAIDGLAKTPANVAKIKQLWNLGTSKEAKSVLTEPLGTFELNVMIKAMASRGKIRAALDLYYESTAQNSPTIDSTFTAETTQTNVQTRIIPDPYTLSSIFTALQDSIVDDQSTKPPPNAPTAAKGLGTDMVPLSQCWQWNEAVHLLTSYLAQESFPSLNNHVFSSLLKLNDRVSQVYLPAAHNGPKVALFLLYTMHQLNISPDVVTCTLIISNLGYQWRTALNLLYAMKTTTTETNKTVEEDMQLSTESSSWQLPRPNVYTYSAVITNCAHCHQYQAAMELLHEMKNDDRIDSPNTWVYNAALLATTRSDSLAVLTAEHRSAPKQKRSRERLMLAMSLLREMQQDGDKGCDPDTVTYNTVLATLDGIASPMEPQAVNDELENQFASFFDHAPRLKAGLEESFEELALHRLLDEMELSNIPRDSITYRNSLLAVRFSDDIRASVQRVLDRAMLDMETIGASSSHSCDQDQRQSTGSTFATAPKRRQLNGKAADGVTFVFDTAMSVLSSRGDVEGVLSAFNQMMERTTPHQKPKPTSEQIAAAQIHFVHALGRDKAEAAVIPLFLNATRGDRISRLAVSKQYPTLDEKLLRYSPENEALYSSAISSCLVANDIENARAVLALMREERLKPSDLSLEEIARTYARLAVMTTSNEFKQETDKKEYSQQRDPAIIGDHGDSSQARTRARNAYNIAVKTLSNPPASLLSTVARTCASLGMWTEATTVLKLLHGRVIESAHENIGSIDAAQTVLPGLHRALLRASSIQGNVTAALSFVDSIQNLSQYMAQSATRQNEEEELLLYQSGSKAAYRQDQSTVLTRDNTLETLGMSAEDWKLLVIAAAKSGHWRVCLSTLQFLRPFLEETHPSSLGITVEERSRRYGHLAPALTVALRCLEKRSQYGWAIRAIDDWIEWCGRRPPKEAVLAAIRILSKRGRGREVHSLLARCTVGDGAALLSYSSNENNYGLVLHVGAITALHQEGRYDDADDAFIAAVRGNFLPFDLYSEDFDGKRRTVLDLHGMNVAVAHSAVRVALQQEVQEASWKDQRTTKDVANDMIIVTGRGRNSALRMRPVLRPEVQRMLVEEFYPPLSTASIPGNMGAVRVPALDIRAWLSNQRRQKGSRMLAVASLLRNISSIDRLRQSIALKIQAEKERDRSNGSKDEGEE